MGVTFVLCSMQSAVDSKSKNNNFQTMDISDASGRRKALDANRYATKKTIAQGMLDVALLTANTSQLKYVLQLGENVHPFYHLMLALIIVSIVLQGIIAILALTLNLLRDCRLEREDNRMTALIINYFSLGITFIISVLQIFIAAFDPNSQLL